MAATCACLLRLHGLRAELAIGVRRAPFEAHAWTELDGIVVYDDVGIPGHYAVVARI
jgi:hypothetical protein